LSGEHRPACRRQGINFISVSSLPDGRQVWFLSYPFILFLTVPMVTSTAV